MISLISIPIVPFAPNLTFAASQLSQRFQLPLALTVPQEAAFFLALTPDYLALYSHHQKINPIYVDFTSGKLVYRRKQGGGRKQPLARAVGLKPGYYPYVLDATAGLGRDGFILAHLGCEVRLLERTAIIAALLEDGLQRARKLSELAALMLRIDFQWIDAQRYLQQLSTNDYPEVIYLDPMYPVRKKTALVKKEMQIFQQIIGQDTDAEQLLKIAINRAKKRVVVKRPKQALPLSELPVDITIPGQTTRFDVYLVK